jgi:hypothetical protein
MQFEQATIPVQDEQGFQKLKQMMLSALSKQNVERYLKAVQKSGTDLRAFEAQLQRGVWDSFWGEQGSKPVETYQKLPVSDQGQVREFFLTQIEEVGGDVRRRYQKLFRYS